MASRLFNNALELFSNGDLDWVNDDIRCLLVTSSFTPDQDADVFVSDLSNELSGGAYVRKTLAGKTTTQNNTSDRADLSADNVTWTALQAAAGTPAYAIIYKFITNDAASPVIGWIELTTPPVPNGGDYTVKWNNGSSSGDIFRNSAA
jgi:hypothetical protein